MAVCIGPEKTERMREILGVTDNVAKIALFGLILTGRHIVPLATGQAASTNFWKRVNQASLVRLGLLSTFFVPDLFDFCNFSMFGQTKSWKENGRDLSFLITDLATVVCLASSLKGLKLPQTQNIFGRINKALNTGNTQAYITRACLVSWILSSTFDLAITKDDASSSSLDRWSRFFHLAFACASSIWNGRATPIAVFAMASGLSGTANHLNTWLRS